MDLMLLTRRPGPPLASLRSEALWYYDGSETLPRKEHVLPNGRFQMVVGLSAGLGAVSGLRSQPIVIEPAAIPSVMGVVFRPGGARGFFEEPADDFYNQNIPIDAVWGSHASQLRDCLQEALTVGAKFQILETVLRRMLQRAAKERLALHPSVQFGPAGVPPRATRQNGDRRGQRELG